MVRPNAPPASPHHLQQQWIYGNETGCDVIFLVGKEVGEEWRLPAHTTVLKEKNAIFQLMFSDRFKQLPTVEIPDVDGRAFDNLLRYLYEEPVSMQSVDTTLGTLYAGHKYQCYGLVRLCIEYLRKNFKETNILLILKFIRFINGDYKRFEAGSQSQNYTTENQSTSCPNHTTHPTELFSYNPDVSLISANASGISASGISNHIFITSTSIEDECSNLLQHCLAFIDNHAIAILNSDEIEDVDLQTLHTILARDTLDVGGDEQIVFSAISKWADKECKRKQLPLTGASKRQLLGDSLYLPRYLTMSFTAFQHGPVKSDLLTSKEIMLLAELIKSGCIGSPKHQTNGDSSSSKNSTLTTANVIKLLQQSPPPAFILPHLPSLAVPRHTRNVPNNVTSFSSLPSSPTKKCGLSFFKLIRLKTRRICCRLSRSRSTSKENTPCASLNSSPIHRCPNGPNPHHGYTNQGYAGPDHYYTTTDPEPAPARSILDRIIVCVACVLD